MEAKECDYFQGDFLRNKGRVLPLVDFRGHALKPLTVAKPSHYV